MSDTQKLRQNEDGRADVRTNRHYDNQKSKSKSRYFREISTISEEKKGHEEKS